jgi:L-ascorbate metabolism protein UlaG (beta-lactamase superfamily)
MAEITWLGHACWSVKTGPHTLLIDPFLSDSPSAPQRADEVAADYLLVSHGHFDHIGDVAAIANRTGATLISNFEICQWFATQQGLKHTLGMNLGGEASLPFGRVKLTLAFHSSTLPDGSSGGNPCGFLLRLAEGKNVYFACDTALFGDMSLIAKAKLDLAVVPIGDLFTMGPDDALEAVKLLQPKRVVPSHFNTWPPIAQDAQAWANRVCKETSAEAIVLKPGESVTI